LTVSSDCGIATAEIANVQLGMVGLLPVPLTVMFAVMPSSLPSAEPFRARPPAQTAENVPAAWP
jgi:hypothetical protein